MVLFKARVLSRIRLVIPVRLVLSISLTGLAIIQPMSAKVRHPGTCPLVAPLNKARCKPCSRCSSIMLKACRGAHFNLEPGEFEESFNGNKGQYGSCTTWIQRDQPLLRWYCARWEMHCERQSSLVFEPQRKPVDVDDSTDKKPAEMICGVISKLLSTWAAAHASSLCPRPRSKSRARLTP